MVAFINPDFISQCIHFLFEFFELWNVAFGLNQILEPFGFKSNFKFVSLLPSLSPTRTCCSALLP
jgi:hypothetical protein